MVVKHNANESSGLAFGGCILLFALLVATAGCGPSGHAATGPGEPTTDPAATGSTIPTPAGRRPVVEIERSPAGGDILVTPTGRTVYHLSSEESGGVGGLACVGPCTARWKPIILPRGDLSPVAPAALAPRLGLIARPDGSEQVTYEGEPLYTAARGTRPGSQATGGHWSAVRVKPLHSPSP